MKNRKLFWPILWVLAVLLMGLWIQQSLLPDEETLRESYGPIALGDIENDIRVMLEADRYRLVGIFERGQQSATWTEMWEDHPPRERLLDRQSLRENKFWSASGWTYPRHPPTSRVMVVEDLDIWATAYVYIYIDDNAEVVGIYVGRT